MNLKNSKFYKRIQKLRRISKEKIRQQKENSSNNFDQELENAFVERNGNAKKPHAKKSKPVETQEIEKTPNDEEENKLTSNGMIHLNNVCFRIKCANARKHSMDDAMPSAAGNKISICVANSRYHMISKISKTIGYRVVKENKMWNIIWIDTLPRLEMFKNMKRFQQVNHFPGMYELSRKDLLARNLNRMLKLFPKDYKIFPKTWIFPADAGDAMAYSNMACKCKAHTFIIKPDAGSRGNGIWLTNDLRSINPTERLICQTYISKPLLIDGYKFDLRTYALITSMDPLRIYVYNEGLGRFATSKYIEPNPANNDDLFMHLTNYSVNKRNSQYDIRDECGSKRNFSSINNWMRRHNHNVNEFWGKVDDIIIKTVLSAWPMLKHNYHACFPQHDTIQACFEILGIDILVDSKLKPYILEVNHSPSYHTIEAVDRQVKRALIRDTLSLVSTVLADKRKILREDRKRVKQRLLKMKPGDSTQRSQNGQTKDADSKQTRASGGGDVGTLSSLSQQIAWEESHLGNFRRVMPPNDPGKLNYYCQFFALENQASIYGETAASKKREESSKKLRLELEEKRAKQQEQLKHIGKLRLDELRIAKRRSNMSRAVIEKQRLHKYKTNAQWSPGFISDAEERLRRSWMQMRMDMVRNMKIVKMVFFLQYNARFLTNADIINYPDLYTSLESGIDILTE